MQHRHRVLQLVAEAERAARLVVAAAREVATADGLVQQPAVGEQVDGWFRRFHLHRAQGAQPADAYFVERVRSRIPRSEEHTSELQSLMRNSYAVFFLKKTKSTLHNY